MAAVHGINSVLNGQSPRTISDDRAEIQAGMNDSVGILCNANDVANAHPGAVRLNHEIRLNGISFADKSEARWVLQWHQMGRAFQAVLANLEHYIVQGGASRGARAVCNSGGMALAQSRTGPIPDVCFRPERQDDK